MSNAAVTADRCPPRRLAPRALLLTLTLSVSVAMMMLAAPLHAASSDTPPASAASLAQLLRQGGYVLVMRHAQSPDTPPTAQAAEPDNPHRERQLSEAGKADAAALGAALHTLGIPIGPIYSSPNYRALETLRLAGLGPARPEAPLAVGSRGMRGSAGRAQVRWLQQAAARRPPAGTDTLIVTHTPNILGAFGPAVVTIQAGEMLVFEPGHGLIGRLTIAQWRELARSAR